MTLISLEDWSDIIIYDDFVGAGVNSIHVFQYIFNTFITCVYATFVAVYVYPSGAPEITMCFDRVCVAQSLVFYLVFFRLFIFSLLFVFVFTFTPLRYGFLFWMSSLYIIFLFFETNSNSKFCIPVYIMS